MKKRRSVRSGRTARRGSPLETVEQYVAAVPEPARSALRKLRSAILSALPAAATETISYRIPAFRYQEIVVWYAAFSDHCSLFPKASVIRAFRSELKGYSTSKGTIHFPIGRPLPVAMIKKIVKARIREIEAKRKRGPLLADT